VLLTDQLVTGIAILRVATPSFLLDLILPLTDHDLTRMVLVNKPPYQSYDPSRLPKNATILEAFGSIMHALCC